MKNNLILEFKRGLLSKKFFIAIFLNCLCLTIGIYSNRLALLVDKGLILYYIGYLLTPGGILSIFVPIIVTFPFAASFIEDREKFFLRNLLIRESRLNYLVKKYLVTGFLGSLAISLPLLTLLLVNIIFLPKGNIQHITSGMSGAFSEVYNHSQLAYALLTIANAAIFGFIYANIGLMISFFIKNKVAAIISPFLLYILPSFFFIYLNLTPFEPSFTFQFNGQRDIRFFIIVLEFLFLLIFSIIAGYIKFIKLDKDEV
ncbi:MAG: hypothetical protein LBS28_00345 [Streptococcaceae bacterium]|jgi:hypothetical protein|nr:hypothetical protein [Streptococcaceae bacterium]